MAWGGSVRDRPQQQSLHAHAPSTTSRPRKPPSSKLVVPECSAVTSTLCHGRSPPLESCATPWMLGRPSAEDGTGSQPSPSTDMLRCVLEGQVCGAAPLPILSTPAAGWRTVEICLDVRYAAESAVARCTPPRELRSATQHQDGQPRMWKHCFSWGRNYACRWLGSGRWALACRTREPQVDPCRHPQQARAGHIDKPSTKSHLSAQGCPCAVLTAASAWPAPPVSVHGERAEIEPSADEALQRRTAVQGDCRLPCTKFAHLDAALLRHGKLRSCGMVRQGVCAGAE